MVTCSSLFSKKKQQTNRTNKMKHKQLHVKCCGGWMYGYGSLFSVATVKAGMEIERERYDREIGQVD